MSLLDGTFQSAADKLELALSNNVKELGEVLSASVSHASTELEKKLDKIKDELNSQRRMTKEDIRELIHESKNVVGEVIDERIDYAKNAISELAKDKMVEIKGEVKDFLEKYQKDIAIERRRMLINVLIAFCFSISVAVVSYIYHSYDKNAINLFYVFRIAYASLAGGYVIYSIINFIYKYFKMSEYEKDIIFLANRYLGVLRPKSLFGHVVTIIVIVCLYGILFVPQVVSYINTLMR